MGTLINILAVLIGGLLGMLFGARFPDRMRATIIAVLGLFTLAIGVQLFLETTNAIIVLVSLLLGAISGELVDIEDRLNRLGTWFETTFTHSSLPGSRQSKFVQGFITASLVFCVGPMAILGSIQDGLTGDFQLLAIKSVLDGFAAMAFASTFGVGVLFSIATVLVYQGSLTLLADLAQSVISPAMIAEMTAAGGLLLMAIAVSSLLEIKPIRVGNLLPALIYAPLTVYLLELLGGF